MIFLMISALPSFFVLTICSPKVKDRDLHPAMMVLSGTLDKVKQQFLTVVNPSINIWCSHCEHLNLLLTVETKCKIYLIRTDSGFFYNNVILNEQERRVNLQLKSWKLITISPYQHNNLCSICEIIYLVKWVIGETKLKCLENKVQ